VESSSAINRQATETPMTTHRYTLVLEATDRPSDREGVRALRLALKRLLRTYGLRAVTIQPVAPAKQEAQTGQGPSEKTDAQGAEPLSPA
jgi:hypothetical protein